MKREDLFLAIGDVEESRLARSETGTCPSGVNHWEDNEMITYVKRRKGIIRGLLIAAIVATLLATTVFAYGGFVVYENPKAMLEAFFGEQPAPHGPECLCAECIATEPTFERGVLNEDAAMAEVAPYISEIGDSVTDERMGFQLTVDAYAYDPSTGCGLVYYTLESHGNVALTYNLQNDGEIWGISPSSNQPCKEYLIQTQSTENSLKIACYFIRADACDDYFRIGFNGLIREDTDEKVEDYLYLPFEANNMKNLSLEGGNIVLSPIGIVIRGGLSCIQEEGSSEPNVDRLVIRYKDGSEYLVLNEDESNVTYSYAYALVELQNDVKITYALNRVIDLDNVSSVIINGTEFPVE